MDANDIIEDLLYQFAYRTKSNGRLALTTGGLSALEGGFSALGWDDPHLLPENECEQEGCHDEATCGKPTPAGYKRLCYTHYSQLKQ